MATHEPLLGERTPFSVRIALIVVIAFVIAVVNGRFHFLW